MAKLLLVEDDNNLREIYQARLTAEGYDIVAAQDGEAALSIAKQEKPDLIISDVMMPRISGFEMLDILRNTDELKNTKVIMLTALGQAEDRGRADNLGADKYLVKSQVTLEDIVSAAKELLAGVDAPAPNAAAPAAEVPPTPQAAVAVATEPAPEAAAPAVAITDTPEPAEQSVVPAAEEVAPVEPIAEPAPEAVAATLPTEEAVTAGEPEPVAAEPIADPVPETVPEPPMAMPVIPASEPAADDDTPLDDGAILSPSGGTTVAVTDPDPLQDAADTTPTTSEDTTTTVPEEPAAEPAPEEVAPVEPIAEPAPEAVAATLPTEEAVTAETTEPTATADVPVGAQDLAEEEAAVQAQINSFAGSDDAGATPNAAVPTPETAPTAEPETPAEANDALLEQAVEDLTQAEEPVLAPAEAAAAAPESSALPPVEEQATESETPVETPEEVENETDHVTVTGKKVIQPLNDVTKAPDLDALLAKEEAKATDAPVEPTPIIDGQKPPTEPPLSFDPNKIAL